MAAPSLIPITKHTIYLREGDMQTIKDRFPRTGASEIIRSLISDFVDTKINGPIDPKQVEKLVKELSRDMK